MGNFQVYRFYSCLEFYYSTVNSVATPGLPGPWPSQCSGGLGSEAETMIGNFWASVCLYRMSLNGVNYQCLGKCFAS